ncbi:MAG: DEAD/DEAH box helicase, partial [Thermofilaceae archaeon]
MDVEELLHPRLLAVARRFKYHSFNQLQLKAFNVLNRGVNAIISAPTGYGKTEASLFPIFSSLLREGCEEGCVSALYITPLRALNRDIFSRMSEIAAEVGLRLEVRHGDTPQSARRRIAEDPPHILITTPETFQLLLVNEKMRGALQHVRWVVVDELHELIPSKRGLQLSIALERLEQLSAHNIQRIGLSATLKNPLAAGYFLTGGRYFELVEVKEGRRYEVEVVYTGSYSDVEERVERLLELINRHRSVIVFVNTRNTAEALGSRLKQYLGDAVSVHHGSLSREQRIETERALKAGKLKCLIATSSLELGIDVGHVDYVIQYMSPRQVNRLVQRVGRSSHFIGGVARGAIIAPDVDELSEAIIIAKRAERGNLEEIEYEELAYDVLAHQLVGLVLERGEVDIYEAHRLISRALPYRNLTLSELRNLANFLSSIKLLRLEGDKLRRGPRSLRYYYESASTIPDVETLDVIDIASRRKI